MIHKLTFHSNSYADPEESRGLGMPDGHRGPVPLGLALTVKLVQAVRSKGWEVPHRWATDYAHAFEVRGGGGRFDIMIACLDADVGSWEVTVEPRTGLLRWLRRTDPATLQRLARDLQALLEADPEIADLDSKL